MKILEIIGILLLELFVFFILKQSKDYFRKWQKILIFICITFFSIFELIKLGSVPGLFGDEALTFYNSYSLAHYGVDANLMHNPVYSLAAGGQSILYEWIAYPFMKMFGMNLAAYRFPMAFLTVLGIILLIYAMYKVKINSNMIAGIVISLICAEWLLMYAHWAMDCNIVIPIFIFALDFILMGINKKIYNYIAIILITLMTYSYVGSWIILPFLYVGIETYLYKTGKFKLRDICVSIIISLILLIPILCYLVVQFMGVKPFKFLWFSVAPLAQTRASSSMIPIDGNILNSMIGNAISGINQLITGNDSWLQSSVPGFAVFYYVMFIFAFYGILKTIKLRDKESALKLIGLISILMLPMVLLVGPNFIHWSLVLLIMFIWSGIGIGFLFDRKGTKAFILSIITMCIVLVSTINFTATYFGKYTKDEVLVNQIPGYIINFNDTKSFMKKLDKLHVDKYYGIPFNSVFLESLKESNPHKINDLGDKYQNNLPSDIQDGSAAYIVPKKDKDNYQSLQSLPFKEMEVNYTKYLVYYNKK